MLSGVGSNDWIKWEIFTEDNTLRICEGILSENSGGYNGDLHEKTFVDIQATGKLEIQSQTSMMSN